MKYDVKFLYYSSVTISVEAENEAWAKEIANEKMGDMSDIEMAKELFDNRTLEGTEIDS